MTTSSYHESKKKQGTIYDKTEKRFFPALIRRRDNPYYRMTMAVRYVEQFGVEKVNRYDQVYPQRWRTFTQALRRARIRYKSFPQPHGIIIAHKNGKTPLPVDISTRTEMVDEWIKNVPEGKTIGGTRGFGGKHAGSREKSKEPERYMRFDSNIQEIKDELDSKGIAYFKDGANVTVTEKDLDLTEVLITLI